MNKVSFISFGVCVALLGACSQPPAPVALKGGNFYGKDSVSQYAQNGVARQPDYAPPKPALAAPVKQINVAELSPPKAAPALSFANKAEPAKASFTSVSIAPSAPEQAVVTAAATPQLEPLPMDAVMPQTALSAMRAPEAPAPKLADLNKRASNFIWPTQGQIVSRFGPKQNGLVNDGINIAAREGEPIWAAAKGQVAYAGNELKGYGNMVIVKHANGWMTAYAHASDMLVKKGDSVNQGDLIGYVGQTGAVTSAQLHFGIREGKTPIDPEGLLPRRVASAQ